MKKIISAVLAFALIFTATAAFAGCSKNEPDNETTESTTTTQAVSTTENTTETTSEPETTETTETSTEAVSDPTKEPETESTTAAPTEQPAVETSDFEGEYQDATSQRATATIRQSAQGLLISVRWGGSSEESKVWEMTGKIEGDRIVYSDCTMTETNGNSKNVVYKDGSGFFEIDKHGILYWNGAADPECMACVFEKV